MIGATAATLAFEVQTARRRYFVPRGHVDQLGVAPLPNASEAHGRPLLTRDLGPLLDPEDSGAPARQALTVLLRRRTVVLRVQRIESLESVTVHPLAPLLRRRLRAPGCSAPSFVMISRCWCSICAASPPTSPLAPSCERLHPAATRMVEAAGTLSGRKVFPPTGRVVARPGFPAPSSWSGAKKVRARAVPPAHRLRLPQESVCTSPLNVVRL